VAVLESFIHPDFLATLRATVDQLTPVCYEGGKRKPLIAGDLKDTVFYEVAFSDFVIQLASKAKPAKFSRAASPQPQG
jgi:hypothetical protein